MAAEKKTILVLGGGVGGTIAATLLRQRLGNFYADPAPAIRLKAPSMMLHLGKVIYEKFWLYRRF
ncbi:MAG: hypothetical protein HYU75_16220 [Betaproteobacteria bacterium]|nr:hypothetical protein [Betaproteobacteria bacterium]